MMENEKQNKKDSPNKQKHNQQNFKELGLQNQGLNLNFDGKIKNQQFSRHLIFQSLKNSIEKSSKHIFKSINEFQIKNQIGKGSFGIVKIAQHIFSGRLYAVKQIDIQNIPSLAQAQLLNRQIRIHSRLVHPHIVRLWDTVIQKNKIYMILQYASRGNLFNYQSQKKTFQQFQAARIIAQVILAVLFIHTEDILHRDIKPQNILLDSDLTIKICDFGWCGEKIHQNHSIFCGTYQYMSPQMLMTSIYDYRIDIWALGVLLYQLLHGFAPFRGSSALQVRSSMLKNSLNIDQKLSKPLKDLIILLLQYDPDLRPSLVDVLNCEWLTLMRKNKRNLSNEEYQIAYSQNKKQKNYKNNQDKKTIQKDNNQISKKQRQSINTKIRSKKKLSSNKFKASYMSPTLAVSNKSKPKIKQKDQAQTNNSHKKALKTIEQTPHVKKRVKHERAIVTQFFAPSQQQTSFFKSKKSKQKLKNKSKQKTEMQQIGKSRITRKQSSFSTLRSLKSTKKLKEKRSDSYYKLYTQR